MASLDNGVTLERVRLLDGTRERTTILPDLAARMAEHAIPDGDGNQMAYPAEWWRERLAPQLGDGLRQIARMSCWPTIERAPTRVNGPCRSAY